MLKEFWRRSISPKLLRDLEATLEADSFTLIQTHVQVQVLFIRTTMTFRRQEQANVVLTNRLNSELRSEDSNISARF